MSARGTVYLVGAGPGDPGLLTLRGLACLERAEVVVFDGLVSPEVVARAPSSALRVYAGKKKSVFGEPLTQLEINKILVEQACAGRSVVRLKGGDPFLFGRGGEECEALAAAGVPFEVVPGVSAATAVAAYAGIPLTLRGTASSVAFATGHEAEEGDAREVNWSALAGVDTVVLFMSLTNARRRAAELMAGGKSPHTPVAAVSWGTLPRQRTVISTLAELGDAIEAASLRPPALLVIGEVVRCAERFDWYGARSLRGARILATRPASELVEFTSLLVQQGAECVPAPVTTRRRLALGESAAQVRDQLAISDWVCFTSANAVQSWFLGLRELGLDARVIAGARLACVGTATAAALSGVGLASDFTSEGASGGGLATSLVTSGAVQRGSRVYFPRAAGGREELVITLRAAGALVEVVPVYETVPLASSPGDDDRANPDRAALDHALQVLRAGALDAVCAFAPSQVEALSAALGNDARPLLERAKIIAAIGPTTATAFKEAGVRVDVVASQPSLSVLVRDLVTAYKER